MSHFTEAQLEVETLVLARGCLSEAEELINEDRKLDDEHKAALWLYGWSLLPHHLQRRIALSYMEELEEGRWSVS